MVHEMNIPNLTDDEMKEKVESKMKILSGRSNPELAGEIAEYLEMKVTPMMIKNFADGETYVKVQESIRGHNVFLIQSTCNPVNEHVMETLITIDALKRASAKSITLVIPYYGYARQDRKASGREAITAKLVANLLTKAGVDRVLAMDLHTGQIQGFFDILVDQVFTTPVFVEYIKERNYDNIVAVSPDAGGVERTRHFAKQLNCPLAIVDKRREEHNVAKVEHVIGDVKGKTALLFDDMIDTAGTITEGAKLLQKEGAKEIIICAAHAVLSGPALQRLEDCPANEIIVSNTIPLTQNYVPEKITQLSIAQVLGEAIRRINNNRSVSAMIGD